MKLPGTELTDVIEECLAEDIPIIEEFFDMYFKPLLSVGTPEKLLDKKYEQWTEQDKQAALWVYGEKRLADFIRRKEISLMYEAERTEV